MGHGITASLAICAACVWLWCVLVINREIGLLTSMVIATVRVGITLVYFAFLFDGTLVMKDDQEYMNYSMGLWEAGWGPLRIITEDGGIKFVMQYVGSGHILYYWYNLLAFSLFGEHYYSAVFMNVGLTFLSAKVLNRFIKNSGFGQDYRRPFTIFFLLHWDLITWSSFVNLKDMIVLCLTITSLTIIGEIARKFSLKKTLLLGGVLWLFTILRYYAPVLIGAGSGAWLISQWKDKRKYLVLPILAGLVVFLLPSEFKDEGYIKIATSPFSALRFFLMPQFWTLQRDEAFLFPSSIMHWALFFPFLLGAFHLWKVGPLPRLALIYAMVIVCFYSIVPDLQGYRHRMQILFIISWCQFDALWGLFGTERVHKPRPVPSPVRLRGRAIQ